MKSEKKVKIIYFGDSVTEGQHISPPFRWTDLLTNYLESESSKNGVLIQAVNKGVSGETSRQGLMRFAEDVQNNVPDILTLQFGLNDCNQWVTDKGYPRVSKAAYKANLVEMIERALHFGVKHIILSNNYPTLRRAPLFGGTSLEDGRLEYNQIVYEVAMSTGVTLCDIDAYFKEIDGSSYSDYLLPDPDLLHLSNTGHNHYFKKISKYLEMSILKLTEND